MNKNSKFFKGQKLIKQNIFFAFSSTHLWKKKTSQSIFEFYKHLRHQKPPKVFKLVISRKKIEFVCFPLKNLTSSKICEKFLY